MRIVVAIFLLAIAAFMPQGAEAHSIESDSTISALIHIDPNDNPVIGRSAFIEFSVTDTSEQFSFNRCDCSLTIKNHDRGTADQLKPDQLIIVNSNKGGFSYTFSEKGSYDLTLAGTTTSEAEQKFEPFVLDFDIQVTNDGTGFYLPSLHSYSYLHTSLFVGVFVIFFLIHFYEKFKNWKTKRNRQN